MASQLTITNQALIRVGADRISSTSQDVRRAVLTSAVWSQCLDTVLRARKWNFARKRAVLAPTGDDPEHGYVYEYDLPNDYRGWPEFANDDIVFEIEGTKLRTDESELEITYNFNQTDESAWDASFADAMAWKLAAEVCFALTRSRGLTEDCEKKFRASIGEAASINGAEDTQPPVVISTWTGARRGRRW